MPFPFPPRRPLPALAAAAAVILALAGCTTAGTGAPGTATAAPGLPSSHVHALDVNPETGQVLLATHEGLFDVTTEPARKIGATNDLMGFTAGHDRGLFFASGHPGKGSQLPNPLGLVASSDGGATWEPLSRQGESDFHTLTTTKSGIIAFDGTLRTSPDGKTWTTVDAPFKPAVLAGHPVSSTVLATTPAGIQRSTDGGATWALLSAGPVIQFAGFASPDEAAGIAPDGTVHTSTDGGATWTPTGRIDGEVQAVSVVKGSTGKPWIWAATSAGISVSTDGGATFKPHKPA
ncbi:MULTISPECIES: F510_1955 family glycosylhydrolase [unclassified Arthrobacter]|uniref:F510_1955 family glycosylhydrolase n=1 Tax=unclassified Arthrobacter TaxID=235627 RepID=UPI001C845414|nr:glycoside hydrolase [Arthrobacter sp. MAHUQ-56]MBX7444841.1 exo-alpha-sialidase [Arthrobacter sp. MAHUQ-56]